MNQKIQEAKLLEYAQQVLHPLEAEHIEHVETIEDEHGLCEVWLVSCADDEEYWLMEGDLPANLYKKSGIFMNVSAAYAAHVELLKILDEETSPDRFHWQTTE